MLLLLACHAPGPPPVAPEPDTRVAPVLSWADGEGAPPPAFGVEGGCWGMRFTNDVDPRSFDPRTWTVAPSIDVTRLRLHGSVLGVAGLEDGSHHVFHVPGSVTDVHGQALGADRDVGVGCAAAAAITVADGPSPVFDADRAAVLHLATRGVPAVVLKVTTPTPSSRVEGEVAVTELRADRLLLGPHADVPVDLGALVGAEGTGQFGITVEGEVSGGPGLRVWAQVTRLGLLVAEDDDELLVWVTRLATGAPVEGATVTVLGTNAAARTDAAGLARLPRPTEPVTLESGPGTARVEAWPGPWTVWARSGDDEVGLDSDRQPTPPLVAPGLVVARRSPNGGTATVASVDGAPVGPGQVRLGVSAPSADLPVDTWVTLRPVDARVPGMVGWSIGGADRPSVTWPAAERTLVTDAEGRAGALLNVLPPDGGQSWRLTFTARVSNEEARAWRRIPPAARAVGLRTAAAWVPVDQPAEVELRVVDLDGRPVPDALVQVTAGTSRCSVRTDTGGGARCPLPTAAAGEVVVRAEVRDAVGRRQVSELRTWAGDEHHPVPAPGRPLVVPERSEVRVGGAARVLVAAPFAPAEGMWTLQNGGIVDAGRFRAETGTTVIEVPVGVRSLPTAVLRVDLLGPHGTHAGAATTLEVRPEGDLLVTAHRDGAALEVVVRDPAGRPVAGAEVTAGVAGRTWSTLAWPRRAPGVVVDATQDRLPGARGPSTDLPPVGEADVRSDGLVATTGADGAVRVRRWGLFDDGDELTVVAHVGTDAMGGAEPDGGPR